MSVPRVHDPGRRILVVDDDAQMRGIVARALQPHGYHVDGAAGLDSGRRALEAGRVDAVVLDIELGGDSGIDLLRELRVAGAEVPVLLLTGRGSEGDRVLGFELGADDYLVKPFFPRELAARVGALLRRRGGAADTLQVGPLRLDRATREAFVDDQVLDLTNRELDLLAALMAAGRRVRTREQLLREVWDSSTAWQTPATVTEHVRRLRIKLEAAGMPPDVVMTVRGLGYRFDAPRAGEPGG
ncbi:response regulator transcription factor [Baekduia soli]|uniref:response regulator transcription factor n=1 Tax=Baekduia soli TaxID=496014 RepID=UPI001E634626|nr:response regulator transcription factor [Baekduia soli]